MFICLPKKEIFTTDTLKKIYPSYIDPHIPLGGGVKIPWVDGSKYHG
jgi:hypothetical protein